MDIQNLTLGEIAAVEDMGGMSISSLSDENAPKTRMLIALVTILKKRSDRNFKRSDAESMTLDEMNEFLGLGEDDSKS